MNIYLRRFLSTQERFESYYMPVPWSGCWIWTGKLSCGGLPYGQFWWNRKSEGAHRASWLLYRGEIPEGRIVCHKCDVPECVNPDHLFLGTFKANTQDMIAKGRNAPMIRSRQGERNNFNKLTLEQVREIKTASGYQHQIAARYGVSQTCVSMIKRGRNWKHASS